MASTIDCKVLELINIGNKENFLTLQILLYFSYLYI